MKFTRKGVVVVFVSVMALSRFCCSPDGNPSGPGNDERDIGTIELAPKIGAVAQRNMSVAETLEISLPLLYGDSVDWSLDSGSIARGMLVDSDGIFRWQSPSENGVAAGQYSAAVRAHNSYGSDSCTVTLHVFDTGQVPPRIIRGAIVGSLRKDTVSTVTVSCYITTGDGDSLSVTGDLSSLSGDSAQTMTATTEDSVGAEYQYMGTVSPALSGPCTVWVRVRSGRGDDSTMLTVEVVSDTVDGYFPADTIVLSANQLGGEGAMIVSRGMATYGSVAISADMIVGVIKDGEGYLYHPKLGDAPLSHYNSRRAMGYFIQGLDLPSQSGMAKARAYPLARDSVSKTGVTVSSTDGVSCNLENTTRRWAVARSSNGRKYFMAPSGSLGKVFGSAGIGNFIETVNNVTSGSGLIKDNTATIDTTPVKITASVYRSVPLLLNSSIMTQEILAYLPERYRKYFPSDSSLALSGMGITRAQLAELSQKAQAAVTSDADIEAYFQVNVLDAGVIIIESLKVLCGASPVEGFETVVQGLLGNAVKTAWIAALTGFEGKHIASMIMQTMFQILTSFWGAVAEFVVPPAAFIGNNALDIIGLFCWVSEVSDGAQHTLQYDVYEQVEFEEPDSGAITLLGSVSIDSAADDVYVEGNYAYVTEEKHGLTIVNIANPASPSVAATLDLGGYSNQSACVVSGNYAYVTDGAMFIVDVGNVNAPRTVSSHATGGRASDLVLAGTSAFVSAGQSSATDIGSFAIMDITSPEDSVKNRLAGGLSVSDSRFGAIAVSGSYAYALETEWSYLYAVDVGTPAAPAVVCSTKAIRNAGRLANATVTISGNKAYIAHNGIAVIDISNPADLTSDYATMGGGYLFGVDVTGDQAYFVGAGEGSNGRLLPVDFSTPADPQFGDAVSMPAGSGVDIMIVGTKAYVVHAGAGDSGALSIWELGK